MAKQIARERDLARLEIALRRARDLVVRDAVPSHRELAAVHAGRVARTQDRTNERTHLDARAAEQVRDLKTPREVRHDAFVRRRAEEMLELRSAEIVERDRRAQRVQHVVREVGEHVPIDEIEQIVECRRIQRIEGGFEDALTRQPREVQRGQRPAGRKPGDPEQQRFRDGVLGENAAHLVLVKGEVLAANRGQQMRPGVVGERDAGLAPRADDELAVRCVARDQIGQDLQPGDVPFETLDVFENQRTGDREQPCPRDRVPEFLRRRIDLDPERARHALREVAVESR